MRRAVLALALAAGCGDGATDTPWGKGPPLPGPRLEPGVIGFQGAIWVIGGFDDALQVSRDVWILDAGATAWRAGPEAPAALTHMNLAVSGDALYLLGGLEGRNFVENGECWRLADEAVGWEPIATMPDGTARGAAATIALDGAVLVAGGATETDAVASVLRYDVAADAWSGAPALPGPRSHPIGTLDRDGAPVVLGGLETLDATAPLDDVLVLAGAAWSAIDRMPTARGGCAAAALDGLLYCAGGEAGAAALTLVEAYDGAGTWITLPPLPEGRAGAGAAAHDGALYVIGGAHRLAWEPVADVDVLLVE